MVHFKQVLEFCPSPVCVSLCKYKYIHISFCFVCFLSSTTVDHLFRLASHYGVTVTCLLPFVICSTRVVICCIFYVQWHPTLKVGANGPALQHPTTVHSVQCIYNCLGPVLMPMPFVIQGTLMHKVTKQHSVKKAGNFSIALFSFFIVNFHCSVFHTSCMLSDVI